MHNPTSPAKRTMIPILEYAVSRIGFLNPYDIKTSRYPREETAKI